MIVCKHCEVEAGRAVRRSDAAEFQRIMEQRRAQYESALQRAAQIAESASYAVGAVGSGVGAVMSATLRGMLPCFCSPRARPERAGFLLSLLMMVRSRSIVV